MSCHDCARDWVCVWIGVDLENGKNKSNVISPKSDEFEKKPWFESKDVT